MTNDGVKGRANNLTMCDSWENNRLRAQRHSRCSKDLTVEAADELTKAAQPGPTEDDGHEVNDSSIAHGTALVPEEPAFSESHCIADCQAWVLATDLEMVRCCLCARWYHLKCVALPPDELGVWPCPDCRHLAREVKSAKEDIQKLVTAINDLTNVLSIQSEHYQTEKFNLNMTITSLEKENATLLTKNSELEDRLRGSSLNSQESSNESASKTLIKGTSLLRNLDEGRLDQSEVRSLSGAKMLDIATELEAMASDGLHYVRVVILAGGSTNWIIGFRIHDDCFQWCSSGCKETIQRCCSHWNPPSLQTAPCQRQYICIKCKYCGCRFRTVNRIRVQPELFPSAIKWHKWWVLLWSCTFDDKGFW